VSQMSEPAEGVRIALTAAATAHILAPSSNEGCVQAASQVLVRIQACLEPHHLDELLSVSGRHGGS
jgi:hypothetical protein